MEHNLDRFGMLLVVFCTSNCDEPNHPDHPLTLGKLHGVGFIADFGLNRLCELIQAMSSRGEKQPFLVFEVPIHRSFADLGFIRDELNVGIVKSFSSEELQRCFENGGSFVATTGRLSFGSSHDGLQCPEA